MFHHCEIDLLSMLMVTTDECIYNLTDSLIRAMPFMCYSEVIDIVLKFFIEL